MINITHKIKFITSKETRDELMLQILEQNRLDEIIHFLGSDDIRLREKTCWILQQMTDDYPEALRPYCNQIIEHLPNSVSDAEKRFIMRYFNFQPLPKDEEHLTQLMNYGFDWLMNPKEAIAQRAFAMTTLFKISDIVPEIRNELKIVIEEQREFGSSGFKNRAKHTLKALSKHL